MRYSSPVKTITLVILAAALFVAVTAPAVPAHAKSLAEELEGDRFLPIGLSAEELEMMDRIGER